MSELSTLQKSLELTDDVAQKICREETYRIAARRVLEKPQRDSRLLRFLNSSLGIFLLSTVVVGLVSWGYKVHQDERDRRLAVTDTLYRIVLEIEYRLSVFETELKLEQDVSQEGVRKNFYSLSGDPQYQKCSVSCLVRLARVAARREPTLKKAIEPLANSVEALEKSLPANRPALLEEPQARLMRPSVADLRSRLVFLETALIDQ